MSVAGKTLDCYYADALAIVNPLLTKKQQEDFCIDYAWSCLEKDPNHKKTVGVSQYIE